MKKAIFICPKFYGYEEHIIAALSKQNYETSYVTHHLNRLLNFFVQFLPVIVQKKIYEKSIMMKLRRLNGRFDLLLVIKGEYLTSDHLSFIQKNSPNIDCVMYQWDSVHNHNYLYLTDYFNRVYTFDFKDSKEFSIPYLPLFYTDDVVEDKYIEKDFDFFLIGVFNPDRYKYYLQMKKFCHTYGKKMMAYIYIPFGYYLKNQILRNRFHIKSLHDVKFKPLSRERLIEYYNRTKVIIDVCRSHQTGLSMRIVESYGLNKKILTTNDMFSNDPYVKEIEFLDIDSTDRQILEFVDKKVQTYRNKGNLTIDQWLRQLLA